MRIASLSILALLAVAACSSSDPSTTGTGGSTSTSMSTGGAGGTGGAGTGGTGGHQGNAQPIDAPAETWTWVPFDNAFCADGSTTGIGVNLTNKSSRVVIYLEGGGACWDELTCYTIGTAANFTTGYGATEFASESGSQSYLAEPGGFFDRSAAGNPFKDYSYIYVPYCTGDIHAGDNVATYGAKKAMHVGFKNMTAYLERITATFPSAERVILAGSSAGGFGATYNWWQTQQAFGKTRVDLIDDSGTVMPADVMVQYEQQQRTTWNLAATLPAGCTACAQHLDALVPFYAQAFPDHRATLLSYTQDSVLPSFFGISTAQFTAGLDELTSKDFDPAPNFHYFLVDASGHVLWFDPSLATNGVTLQQHLTQMVTDDPAWGSVHP